jgi:predicted TIM-barrel fold metal-dependent hydrolase
MQRRVGLNRTVLVQASGYGEDNRAMLDALARLGARARGVAVVRSDLPQAELEALHAAGVRGVRFNLATLPSRYPGDRIQLIDAYARSLAPLGWHLQVFADAATLTALEPVLARCTVNVVIDHMGLPDAAAGIEQGGFQAVLRLLKNAHVWVKLAGADRITRSSGRLRDAIPFMRALARVASERLVWGTDWPHLGFHSRTQVHGDGVLPYRDVDEAELLAVLTEALGNEETLRAVLVDNPARLYGF